MLLVTPLHFVNDGGGVNVETQTCAEFKKPLCNDVQFVEGEVDFDRLGVVVLVVLVVLKEGGRKKINLTHHQRFTSRRSPYLNLTNVKHWPDGQSPGPLQVTNPRDPHPDQGVRGDRLAHGNDGKTDVFQVDFFVP